MVLPVIATIIGRLERRVRLDDTDRRALASLPFTVRPVEAGRYLVREGSALDTCMLLLEGFAFRHKLTNDGARQIVSLQIPGDFFDLQGSLLNFSDHNVQTLTPARIASTTVSSILAIIRTHPRIAQAMWIDTLVEASIFREWLLNIGQRGARQRIGHLLCEIGLRMEMAGQGLKTSFHLPMTQEHIADATGLTSVHVNRSLKALASEGLIRRERRQVDVPDWDRLAQMSGFNPLYLHLDQFDRRSPNSAHIAQLTAIAT